MTVEHMIDAQRREFEPGEPASVWTTVSGAPERLVWRGRRFLVHSKPIPWVDRIEWWMLEQRVPRKAAMPIEQRMWQVQIRAIDDGEILLVDLAADTDGKWRVMKVHD